MRRGFLFLATLLCSNVLFGQIIVSISTPGNLIDTAVFTVRANATPGEFELTSVVATIENRSVSLINIGPYYQGNLSGVGLTVGNTYVLTVTATDAMGNQGVATKNVLVDPPPKINIQFPINYEVATPDLHIKADAVDNSDCRVVVVVDMGYPTYRVALRDTFFNSVDTTINLSDSVYQGEDATVQYRVIDSKGQILDSYRFIYIEGSPYLQRLFSTEGIIKDFNYGKLLSYFQNFAPDNNRNSIITDINTGVVSNLPSTIYTNNWSGAYGNLTPTGAVFFDGNNSGALMDWNNGTSYSLGSGGSSSLYVAGPYVIWSGILFESNKLYLRNTLTRTTQLISTVAGNSNNGVAENGTVAFWSNSMPNTADNGIYRYYNGVTTRINAGVYAMTDGRLIIYGGNGVSLYDGTTNVQLSPSATSPWGDDYQVRNGWAAYTKPGLSGQKQVWLRDTAGVNTQLTFYSTNSTINANGDGVGADGSVCFTRNFTSRYIYVKSSNRSKAICTVGFSKMFYRDSSWHAAIGRVLFKIDPDFLNKYYTVKNGNWSNPATWYGNVVPPAGADVTVRHSVVADVNTTCNSLMVETKATLAINPGISVSVSH